WQSVQGSTFVPEQEPDAARVTFALALAGLTFLFGLAVFFIFPIVLGGILGQVRDRIESPDRPTGSFGAHARSNYVRLLGSETLFLLVTIVVVVPVMILAAALTVQAAWASSGGANQAVANRQIFQNPLMVVLMLVAMAVLSAAGMVYWMA